MKSIKFHADALKISTRRLRCFCETGRVDGAEKIGKTWILPDEITIKKAGRKGPTPKVAML